MNTFDRIKVLIVQDTDFCGDEAEVVPEAKLAEGLGLDSLDVVSLTMAAEDEFDILIDDEAAADCLTVADVVAMVDRARGATA